VHLAGEDEASRQGLPGQRDGGEQLLDARLRVRVGGDDEEVRVREALQVLAARPPVLGGTLSEGSTFTPTGRRRRLLRPARSSPSNMLRRTRSAPKATTTSALETPSTSGEAGQRTSQRMVRPSELRTASRRAPPSISSKSAGPQSRMRFKQ
jgi:hypothetical protein